MLGPVEPTLDSRTSAFWTGRPLHLAELGIDLEWHGEGRLGALLRLTGGCMDTAVAVALAYLRGTEHWPELAESLPGKLRRNSLGDQTSLIRDVNALLPVSLRLELDQAAPKLSDFARKVLPKNTPRSGPVTLQQGLEALVAWRNAQVHPSADAGRAQIPYDEAEAALLAVVESTPALGLRLYYGTAFGTTAGGAPGLRMTLLSWPGPRPYRKGEPMALPGPPPLHHVLAVEGEEHVLDLHPFLTFDGRKLHVFQCFRGGARDGRRASGAVVWNPKTQEVDAEAGAEVSALFPAEPRPTPARATEPSAEAEPSPAPEPPEVAGVHTKAVSATAPASSIDNHGSTRGAPIAIAAAAVGLLILACLTGTGFLFLGDGSDRPPSGAGVGPLPGTQPVSTEPASIRQPASLLSAVSNGTLRWGDSVQAVVASTGGTVTPSGRGACRDGAWRHVEMPIHSTRIRGTSSAHAWVDSQEGFFEINVFTDPARMTLADVVAQLEPQLGQGRAIRSRRFSEPLYRWDRGSERLNTAHTTHAEVSLTHGLSDAVIVRVLDTAIQTRATEHLHRACPE